MPRPPFYPVFVAVAEAHSYELQRILLVVSILIPYLSQYPKRSLKLELQIE